MNQGALCSKIQELFEIEIIHNAVALSDVALSDVALCLGHRRVSGASRSEAVAVLGKRRVPFLLEYLQQGLLDQPVDDTRYAERSDPAIRLGYDDPLDRLRLINPFEQLRPNAWPVFT